MTSTTHQTATHQTATHDAATHDTAADRTAADGTGGIRIGAIDPAVLGQLRERDDAGHQPRLLTDEDGGSPLRCCLRGSHPGERIALVSYAPLRRWARQTGADPGPYEELGPVFIHPDPCEGPVGDGFPPGLLGAHRVFRAYSADGSIRGGRLVEPADMPDAATAEAIMAQVLSQPDVALVHVRAVEFGCFLAEARRA
jgi:hypothetical protein